MFQFKINHDIVCTRDKLFKAKRSESEQHLLFISCQINTHSNTNVHLSHSPVTVLYDNFCPCKHQALTNHALLVAKYFIYKYFLTKNLWIVDFTNCSYARKPSLKNMKY